MAIFYYKAKDKQAKTITGQVHALTKDQAVEMVTELGLLPIIVQEEPLSVVVRPEKAVVPRMNTRELYLFSRQLASLIKAGISIISALKMLADQSTRPAIRTLIFSIQEGIKDGRSFSDCLSSHAKIFSPLYVAMVRVGEEGGNLKEVLQRLADHLQKEEEISSKVRTALAYPLLMAVVGAATVFFILTFVMPRITQMFTSLNQTLPWPTARLMEISGFFEKFWVPMGVIVGAGLIGLYFFSQTMAGKIFVGQITLRIPLIKDLELRAQMTGFCRALELLLKSGVSLVRGLSIAPPILTNEVIKEKLLVCRKDVEAGQRLSESLQNIPYVPAMMLGLIRVGEESGGLENSLREIADIYEQETNESIKTMTTLLEPLMILAVGLVIGMMVLAMLLPIFQMDILAQ